MPDQTMNTTAAIDIGSNSTEVLIAHCHPQEARRELEIVKDESAMLRLGESVKATGEISTDQQEAAVKQLRKFYDLAQQHGADPILAVATEATRKARNREEFVDQVWRTLGLRIHVIPGEIEATLTFHGALYASQLDPNTGVLDVGGGSTELVTAENRHISWLASFPIGSGWLHDQFLFSNPPLPEEREKAQAFLQGYLKQISVPQPPPALMVTGSSVKALRKICQQALELDPHSDELSQKNVRACQELLYQLTAEEVSQRYGEKLERAKVLPGGAMLILTMLEYLQLDTIHVSKYGLREGVLLAYTRYGEHWLDHPEVRLDPSHVGQPPALPKKLLKSNGHNETFAQTGREELPRRAQKFLEWESDVLKGEDSEAVHKMRVASRRLRAAMDAYEPACKRKPFRTDYRQVKQAADLLGQVRDTDVMLEHIQGQRSQAASEEQAGMDWLIQRLQQYRQGRQQELERFLQHFHEDTFEQKVTECIPTHGGTTNG